MPNGVLALALALDGSRPCALSCWFSILRWYALALRSVSKVSLVRLRFPVGAPNSSALPRGHLLARVSPVRVNVYGVDECGDAELAELAALLRERNAHSTPG